VKHLNKYLVLLFTSLGFYSFSHAQVSGKPLFNTISHRIVFYNLENFFDARVDSTRDYNEFTPNGDLHWTNKKYQEKRSHIFQVLTAISEWKPITLMGFVEIENAFVLHDLIENTPLGSNSYKVVHFESDDHRGIDVGIIYLSDQFKLLSSQKIKIKLEDDPDFRTRDILYVKGLLSGDTLHVFVNHWVSRWRGIMESQYLRIMCAKTLKTVIDSVCTRNPKANILVMGDFNDNPEDQSILELTSASAKHPLINIPLKSSNKEVKGTLKYGSEWSFFDQFIVSETLLSNKTGLYLKNKSGHIFDAPFILEKDEKNLGVKPKRTHIGFKYNGGFSDHLPIFIDIFAASKTE